MFPDNLMGADIPNIPINPDSDSRIAGFVYMTAGYPTTLLSTERGSACPNLVDQRASIFMPRHLEPDLLGVGGSLVTQAATSYVPPLSGRTRLG